MTYDYDRRRLVADVTAAPKVKIKPVVPSDERDQAVKHLSEVWWIMKEWVIRSNPDFAMGHEYGATAQTYRTLAKLRDDFDDIKERIQRVHPNGTV